MVIIKCKMCGGDIEISADKTFGTCEYCGSTMTLPKTDDNQRLSLFNRGTHLRRNGEFDKAAAIYERLIGENDADAEAHWNLLLCRYGIEYVQDPASGERIPTCHRASFDSILNDVDYQAALQYSDGVARSLYEKEAQRIAALQKDILAISQKETPFDAFICYKESDENGKRTKDSALAQDIYYQLTDAGYKVFFARITLEDKLGQEYEPYIFAALHSAKVMVVVGTKPEYLNAVWVKNEWSRYLALMRTDRSRLLIPCYRDMDPYDMPEELSMLQSQDMGRIGFIQDLIRGVKKGVDAAKPQEAVTETVKETVVVHNETSGNVQALLDRGQMALEDGEWTKADEFFEQVLNQDAKCGAAYLGKFLAKARKANVQAYVQSICAGITADAPTKRNAEACAEDQAFIDACIRNYQVPEYYAPMDIRTALRFDRGYCADQAAYFRDAQKKAMQRLNDDRNFARAEKFASGETKAQCEALRTGLTNALRQQEQTAEQEAAAEKQRVTEAYRAFLKETEPKLAAKQKQALAKQEDEQKRKEEFERLRAEQKKRAEEAEKLAAQEAKLKAAKAAKTKKLTLICAVAAAAIIAVVLIVIKVIIPSVNYSKAEKLLAVGDYDGAITAFTNSGDYKDAAEQLAQAKDQKENERLAREAAEAEARNVQAYADAETLLTNGDYDGAIAAFTKLGEYQDAASRVKDAEAQKQEAEDARAYQEAVSLQEGGDYEKAADAFASLGSYNDAAEQMKECKYLIADQFQTQNETAKAAIAFGKLAGYKDAKERSFALWNSVAERESIVAKNNDTVGLKTDGSVVVAGQNSDRFRSVSDWTDIVAISVGYQHIVGLKSNGTVVAAGRNQEGQCDVAGWTNIVAISAGTSHTVGLKADGSVVVTKHIEGETSLAYYGEGDVSNWSDIVAVLATGSATIGRKVDGTVVACGYNDEGAINVSGWRDITAIAAGRQYTIGLKSNGTVAAAGYNNDGRCDVSGWTNIIALSAGNAYAVGLKSNGTVVVTGKNRHDECNVSDWTDIVAISANSFHTVGLKRTGTVVSVGWNIAGECNVSSWTNIVAIRAGETHTVGVKADGTVVATGQNNDGQCNVSSWTDIKIPQINETN